MLGPHVRTSLVLVSIIAGVLTAACADDEFRTDASVNVPVDADTVLDAAIDAPIDAAATCAGTVVGGHCWYKGALGASCTTVCTGHGGVDAATVTAAGAAAAGDRTNLAGCQAVIAALSLLPFSTVDNVNESNDYGCVEEPDKSRCELVSLATTVTTSGNPLLARFCACAL